MVITDTEGKLNLLGTAINYDQPLLINYDRQGQKTDRIIYPKGFTDSGNLQAFCMLRKSIREFKIDRICFIDTHVI